MYRFRLIRGRLGTCESEPKPADVSSVEFFSRSETISFTSHQQGRQKNKLEEFAHQMRTVYGSHPNRPLANYVVLRRLSGTSWTLSEASDTVRRSSTKSSRNRIRKVAVAAAV